MKVLMQPTRERIVMGPDGLGNCPRCGFAIAEMTFKPEATETHARGLAPRLAQGQWSVRCIMGHEIEDVETVRLWDGPSPLYPNYPYA